ncbi:LCP family protein [Candidatus Saccharibacteria bacterium]|nr:LCP family protein [Candidatus Saccharibacteria bacterium]
MVANKKTTKRTTRSSKSTRRKVVDPMMIPRDVAKANEDVLAESAIDNGVDFDTEEDNTFLDDDDLYDIDDLYDKKDDIIEMDEDTLSKNKSRLETRERRNNNKKYDKKAERARKKAEKKAKRKTPLGVKIFIGFLIFLIIAIVAGGFYVWTILSKTSNVFQGNPMDILIGSPLAKDEYGRTNVLIFGTAEDDEGHGGAELTDSILVASIDQDKKIGSVFSIPRDLWVNYSVPGEESIYCSVGYKGKINATYFCAKRNFDDDKEKGAKYFSKKIAEVTGLNIQYYVAVDFSVLRDVVNTLGGIDVDVHATDERGILDYCMQNLKLDKGMNYNLDGDTVLRLARARNAKGGYGLANSNFDREINQQRIMNAIKAKALSIGILANPVKVISMIDDLGNNIKTNVTMAEMRTVIDFVVGMKGDLTSIDTRKQFGTGNINGQSVVIPAGASTDVSSSSLYNYTKFQRYIRSEIDKATEESEKSETETEENSED